MYINEDIHTYIITTISNRKYKTGSARKSGVKVRSK